MRAELPHLHPAVTASRSAHFEHNLSQARPIGTTRECNTKARRFEDGSEEALSACIEVHRHLGPGLLESVYEQCLCHELSLRRIAFTRQVSLPVLYKGEVLDNGFRLDVVIESRLVLELKSVDQLTEVHRAQLITYLRLAKIPVGLLINFNVVALRHGIRRVLHDRP